MNTRLALANVADSRSDFLEVRRPLIQEELSSIDWLRQEYCPFESDVLHTPESVAAFAERATSYGAQALAIHFPIWADPIFSVKLANFMDVPILLLGNNRPETSSMVGMLGAGGALDQIGRQHFRQFGHSTETSRQQVRAFVRAATTLDQLHGQTLVLFGGRSLGIFTAVADPAQWQRIFGVDLQYVDQGEIITRAEAIPQEVVDQKVSWLLDSIGEVRFEGPFNRKALDRQMRSYLSTKQLASEYGADFVGVKCQSELSDGYVTQCVSHMIMNGSVDADGPKPITVHACESDADGALSMQILHLISGGSSAALMDIRWYDPQSQVWTLANCGAIPAGLCATCADPTGLSAIRMEPHVFGRGGGGALPATVNPQTVTLARLCRKNGEYWMAIVLGTTLSQNGNTPITPAFPKAYVRSTAGIDFLKVFGSNHIHLVAGDYTEELIAFCTMAGLEYRLWK
jgi:L-fucose isomerase